MNTAYQAIGILLLMAGPAAAGQVHKWVDERGVTHYSDVQPNGVAAKPIPIDPNVNAFGSANPSDCNTIRCQYERLRADRLRAQDDERRELVAAEEAADRSRKKWTEVQADINQREAERQRDWNEFRYSPTPGEARAYRDRRNQAPIIVSPGW
ncbi:MAG: DUF4124 domain-containing protein, partial [Burkholderiales bacterium]|nr:DUF4124 domain-containing protein [Burkholderiales bacterium]